MHKKREREKERESDREERVEARLTQSSVPQLMFAGPGEPAGATADNYPRDTSHVATACTSAPIHFVHLVAPYRIHTHRKKHTKIARQGSPATRTVTQASQTYRPRNH